MSQTFIFQKNLGCFMCASIFIAACWGCSKIPSFHQRQELKCYTMCGHTVNVNSTVVFAPCGGHECHRSLHSERLLLIAWPVHSPFGSDAQIVPEKLIYGTGEHRRSLRFNMHRNQRCQFHFIQHGDTMISNPLVDGIYRF